MAKRRSWTEKELKLLVRLYPDLPTHQVAKRLKRTEGQVYGKANSMELHKSDAFKASPLSGRLRSGHNFGGATRFKKGETPWNKGVTFRAGGRSEETRFKPGYHSHNKAQLGAERIRSDGYRERKVQDIGYPPKDWKCLHIILWEEHYGHVPKGHIVVFKNGNKEDIRIENMELLTRAENMRRNTIHRYPPELRHSIRAVAKLRRKIKEAEDEKQD